ncbi:FlgD immunoglobulin-like domain containing protein [Candidatus Neomarinimicrobiota bacterium]
MKQKLSCFIIFLVVLIFPFILQAQVNYNKPESVVYDATKDRYLVTNKGSGDIISAPRTDPDNLSFFKAAVCASLRGITIVNSTVWCAGTDNDGVRQFLYAYDLNTGAYVKSIQIASGIFVNDVSAGADEIIYLSDTGNNNIYTVNTNDGSYSTLLSDAGANGLLYEADKNRLLYTDDSPLVGSQISAINLNTDAMTVLEINPGPPTVVSSLDGLTVDHLGNYYVSSWSPHQVHRYNSNVKYSGVASVGHPSTGSNIVLHNGPADIFFDQVNNVLAVPNFNSNTVDFIPFTQLSTLDEWSSIPSEFRLQQNFPNPFNPTTTINYQIPSDSQVSITVYDLMGKEVKTIFTGNKQAGHYTVGWDGRNNIGQLVSGGVYLYNIKTSKFTQTRKMILLK